MIRCVYGMNILYVVDFADETSHLKRTHILHIIVIIIHERVQISLFKCYVFPPNILAKCSKY